MKKGKTLAWKLLFSLMILSVLMPVGLFVGPVRVARADTTTTLYSTNMDSYIRQDSAGSNYGDDDRMYVRSYRSCFLWWCTNYNRRSFVRFNVSIPSNATIISARLRLYMDESPGNRTYQAFRVTQNWSEGSIRWNNQPNPAGAATASINTGTSTGWKEWDVTSDVQNWYNNPGGFPLYGWMIRDASENSRSSRQSRFRASEYTGTSNDPRLIIVYNRPPNTPSLASPDDGAYTNNNPPPILQWTAATPSDPDGDPTTYEVRIDGTDGTWNNVGTSTSYTASGLGDGPHTWEVRACDDRICGDSTGTRDLIVDLDTPAVPGHLYEGTPDQDYYPSTDYDLDIDWPSVSDTGSGINYELERCVNGGTSGSCTDPGDWTNVYSGDNTNYNDVDFSSFFSDDDFIEYRVRAVTGAGNPSGWQPSDGVLIDAESPAQVGGVGEGVVVGTDEDWNRLNDYYVYWNTVLDTGSGISYEVQRSVNGGSPTDVDTTVPPGVTCEPHSGRCWVGDPVSHPNTSFITYMVRAVNGVGNTGSWSASSDGITIDSSEPESSVATGIGGIPYTPPAGANPWPGYINGYASDPGGSGVAQVHVRIQDDETGQYWSGSDWNGTATSWVRTTTTSWVYGFAEPNLTDGHTYLVESRASDVAGNIESSYGSGSFMYAATAPEAPVVTSTTHLDPDTWYNNDRPSFQWSEPDSFFDLGGYSFLLDTYPYNIPDTVIETNATTYDYAARPDGEWYFHVRAVDVIGQGGATGHVRVRIDTTTPQAPAEVTEGSPDVEWDADGDIIVHWSGVPDTGSGIEYEVERCVNGGACSDPGDWTSVDTGLAGTSYHDNPGGYTDEDTVRYRVRATNHTYLVALSGGWTDSDGMTIDSIPPEQPGGVFEDASNEPDRDYHSVANGSVIVHWDTVADTGSGITYRLEKQINTGGWDLVAEGLTVNSCPDSGSYSDGDEIVYRVTGVNGVGRESAPRESDGFMIDTDMPTWPEWVREGDPVLDWDYDDDGAFTVYWDDVLDTGSGITYRLQKSINDGGWQLVVPENIDGTSQDDTNSGISDGASIRYRVTPVNGAGTEGPYRLSDGIIIDLDTPQSPAWIYENDPDVDFDTDGAVWVNWAAVPDSGSGITYELQKQVTPPGGWTTVDPALAVTSYNDTATYPDETFIEYRVIAHNSVGRSSAARASDGVRVDTGTPGRPSGVGEGDVVGSDDDFDRDNTFFVYWTGVSPTANGDQIYYTIERNVNGSGWTLAVTGLTATSWDDPQAYSNGDQIAYHVIAINGAGTSGSASVESDGITIDTGRPNSEIQTSGYYNAVSWPDEVEGTASDDYSEVALVEITIYDSRDDLWWNGTAWQGSEIWLTASGTTNWTYPLADSNLTDDHAYNLSSRATDNAGNVETSLGTSSFIFADSGPEAPVVSSPTTHPDEDTWYNNNAPAFTWTTPGGPAPIVGYSYVLDQNPGTTPDAVVDTTGNTRSYTGVADGTWYFHVRALDNAGTWGPAGHYRINVDTINPPAPDEVTDESPDVDYDFDGSITVYWTAVPDTGSGISYIVERQIGAAAWTVLSDTVQSTWYLDPDTGYVDGTFIRYRVSARNGVNLTGPTTNSDGFTVDSDAPGTPAWVTENQPDPNDEDYDPDGSVRVYWAASNDTGSGLSYRLERQVTVGGIPGGWLEIASGLTGTSYDDPLTHGDDHFVEYRVTAVNGVGSFNPPATSDGILIDTDTPAAPAEVTEDSPDIDWSVDGSVTVFWSGVSGTGTGITYELWKQVNTGAWNEVVSGLPSSTTNHPDSGSYNDGDTVRYRVRATNGVGTRGGWRESDGMTIDSSTPAAPGWVREENPDVDYDANGALTVYWAAVADTGSGIAYNLERCVDGGLTGACTSSWDSVAMGIANTYYYAGQTWPDGTTIRYRVTAVNGVGTPGNPAPSDTSDGVTVDDQDPDPLTGVGEGDVIGTDDVFDQDNAFYVFWDAVTNTGSGITYDIRRSLNWSNWALVASEVSTTSWENLMPYSNGDFVRYQVRAVSGVGLPGGWSPASSGITLDFALPDSAVTTSGFYNLFNWPDFIYGTANDSPSDVAFVDISIQRQFDSQYWNGTDWQAGEAWVRATGTINWQYAFTPDDGETYDIRSRATDNAGNVEVTFGVGSFTYSEGGPDAPVISSPTHPDEATWHNNNDPTLNWTTPSSGAGIRGYSYLLNHSATTVPDGIIETYENTVSLTDLDDGTWHFHVRAQDNANNWGDADHFQVNIDTTAPAAPDEITEESPDVDWDPDGDVTVYWSAVSDTVSDITYRLERNLNGVGGWELVAEGLAVTEYADAGYANGDNVLYRVQSSDEVGLTSGWTESDGVTFDLTTPPAPANVGEGDVAGTDDDWDQDNNFFVFWDAVTGAPSGITYSIERSRNGGAWEEMVTGLIVTQWEDPTSYSSGENVAYQVTAHTGAGRSSTASDPSDGLTLDFVRPDSVVETNGYYNNFTWPGHIQGTASDSLSDVDFVEISIQRSGGMYWNDTGWQTGEAWLETIGASNWQYDFAPEDGETYTVRSRATDNAGNEETTLGTSTFNYASTGPGAPEVSSPTHTDEGTWYNDSNPTFEWTAPPSGSGISGYSYVLDQAPDTEPDLSADTSGNSRHYTNVADGTWYFHVRALDNAGNWGSPDHFQVNIDTTNPPAPDEVTEESPDVDWDADGDITVYWSEVSDTSDVTYILERSTNGGGTWEEVATGLTTASYLDPVTHGDNVRVLYHVRAVDAVNLTGPWTQSNGVTIDSETPAQPAGLGEGDIVGTDDAWDEDNTFYVFWDEVANTGSGIRYTIERSVDGGAWEVVQADYVQTFLEDPHVFADGEIVRYQVTAVNGVDTVGPVSAVSSGITLDFTAPDSAIETVGTYGPVSWPGHVAGTADDTTSGVSSVHITLQRVSDGYYWNGGAWVATLQWLVTSGTTAWTYDFAPEDGEHYSAQSRATDAARNVEISYGVSTFDYTTSEPDSAINTSGLYVGADWPGQIEGVAWAPMAALDHVDLTLQRTSDGLYFDGTSWADTPTWLRAADANPWTFAFTPDDGETYVVESRATDMTGNMETSYGTGNFSHDVAAPEIETVNVTSDGTYFYNPGLDTDSGTVYFNSEPGEGADQALTVDITFAEPHPASMASATAFGDTPALDTAAPWSVEYSVEAYVGTQTDALFTVADTLGLTDTTTINFVQDNLPPDSEASIADDATNTPPVVIDWETNDNASGVYETHLWVKYQPIGDWTDTGLSMTGVSGSFLYTPTSGSGTYYFATVAVDNVGNVQSTPTGFGDDRIDFDDISPESSMNAPTYAIVSPIVITWTASHDAKFTYLYYRYGETGDWHDVTFSSAKSGTFEFEPTEGDGHYYFATVSMDDAGNAEAIPLNGKALTIYDTTPPVSEATSPPEWGDFEFTVEWMGDDTAVGSGIAFFDVQVKVEGDGEWNDWITHTLETSAVYTATYVGEPDAIYHFRSQATDNAGHVEDWPTDPEGDTTTTVHFPGGFPGKCHIYVPLVFRDYAPALDLPDLVVSEILVMPDKPVAGQAVDIVVTIENRGTRAAGSCFWIDLYINPIRLPIEVNRGWFDAGSEGGLVWSLCGLDAGESITLHLDDEHFWSEYSRFEGSFTEPVIQTLYAQVDSWNPGTDYGAEYESDEQNNVYGPYFVDVGGVGGVTSDGDARDIPVPPSRPNIPPH